jgi:hypothetical protein
MGAAGEGDVLGGGEAAHLGAGVVDAVFQLEDHHCAEGARGQQGGE